MKEITHARTFDTAIKGYMIPRFAIYGKIKNNYYYCTDLERLERDSSHFITIRISDSKLDKPVWKTRTIRKDCVLGQMLTMYALDNIPFGTRCPAILSHQNYKSAMNHSRKHKKSTMKPCDYKNVVTDYECSKKPLHDFNRCYC